mmetsp:Transcript_6678/g.18541  ORF Transcript_6678/g.18541 Transcript_6678/m.18541 type:complete len:225 (-) Transcript_6678:2332-3006(-)
MTTASSTAPYFSKYSRKAASSTVPARPPTKIFFVRCPLAAACMSLLTGDSSLGSARLASTSLRSIVCCMATTLSTTAGSSKVTKPKPRGRPDLRSYDTYASSTRAKFSKYCLSLASDVSQESPPTNIFASKWGARPVPIDEPGVPLPNPSSVTSTVNLLAVFFMPSLSPSSFGLLGAEDGFAGESRPSLDSLVLLILLPVGGGENEQVSQSVKPPMGGVVNPVK